MVIQLLKFFNNFEPLVQITLEIVKINFNTFS